MENERLPYLHDKALKLPLRPGVYLMHDKKDEIIYVGKAKALKNRVTQYFTNPDRHRGKVRRMVQRVYDFEFVICESEFEALVLECSLIKLHMPKYNILMKDDRGYNYIRITNEPFPRIQAARQRDADGEYLGPYMSSYAVRNVVSVANEAFLLPTCNKQFPRDFGKGRPCLNYHIKQCMGLCRGRISQEQYREVFEEALNFLRRGQLENEDELRQKMEQAAEAMDYEKAAKYRDRIRSIHKITEKQKVINSRIESQDLLGFVQSGEHVAVALIKFRNHTLVDKQDFLLEADALLPAMRSAFLTQFYGGNADIPPYIALDGEAEDQELVEKFLSEQAGRRVHLFLPQRGEQTSLVKMAVTNAAERLALDTERSGREVAALDDLAKLLGLPGTPSYIEAYDISHMGGENIVGGMVVFEDGRPLKSNYRKFSIKTLDGQDDYAAMREVLTRRMDRYLSEQGTESAFARLPDLILLDGGKGHVSAILPVLADRNLTVPVFGMVKDSKHKTRAIARDGGEIAIAAHKSAFTLVNKIQEEVHRFAIAYQQNRQKATTLSSTLEKIDGVGRSTADKLMKQFGTMDKIRQASEQELAAVPGISARVAKNIVLFFAGE